MKDSIIYKLVKDSIVLGYSNLLLLLTVLILKVTLTLFSQKIEIPIFKETEKTYIKVEDS